MAQLEGRAELGPEVSPTLISFDFCPKLKQSAQKLAQQVCRPKEITSHFWFLPYCLGHKTVATQEPSTMGTGLPEILFRALHSVGSAKCDLEVSNKTPEH